MMMIMDILSCKRRHKQVCFIFNILKFQKTNFCNLVKSYKKINEKKDIAIVVTETKRIEYTTLKLYGNKTRA